MKRQMWMVAAAVLISAPAAAAEKACPTVVPGTSIGEVKLGTVESELKKLKGLKWKEEKASGKALRASDYEVFFDQDTTTRVRLDATQACFAGGYTVSLTAFDEKTVKVVSALTESECRLEIRAGATAIACPAAGLELLQAKSNPVYAGGIIVKTPSLRGTTGQPQK